MYGGQVLKLTQRPLSPRDAPPSPSYHCPLVMHLPAHLSQLHPQAGPEPPSPHDHICPEPPSQVASFFNRLSIADPQSPLAAGLTDGLKPPARSPPSPLPRIHAAALLCPRGSLQSIHCIIPLPGSSGMS